MIIGLFFFVIVDNVLYISLYECEIGVIMIGILFIL